MRKGLPSIEELSLRFLEQEIDLGLTVASIAAMEYTQERFGRGYDFQAHAEHSCAEAERRMEDAVARGWYVSHVFRDRLQKLRESLAVLKRQAFEQPPADGRT